MFDVCVGYFAFMLQMWDETAWYRTCVAGTCHLRDRLISAEKTHMLAPQCGANSIRKGPWMHLCGTTHVTLMVTPPSIIRILLGHWFVAK